MTGDSRSASAVRYRIAADPEARRLASSILEAEKLGGDAQQLRIDMFFVLIDPKVMIVEQVMRRAPGNADDRIRDDISSQMVLFLERTLTRAQSGFDLASFTRQSPTDTVLRMLHAAYPKFEAAAFRKLGSQVSTTFDSCDALPVVPPVTEQIETFRSEPDLDKLDLAEVAKKVYRMRSGARTEVGAKLLHDTYDIPEISAPVTRVMRNSVLRKIAESPAGLRESLLSLVHGDVRADPDLVALWARFSPEQADALLDRDDRVLLTVVTAALSPRPAPSRSEVQQLREIMEQGSRNEKWPVLSRRLIRTWLAEFTGRQVGVGDSVAEDPKITDAWLNAVQDVLDFPGRPLGAGVKKAVDVDNHLQSAIRRIKAQ